MRLTGRLGFFYKILFIEAGIVFLVWAVFYGQFGGVKSEVIDKAVVASELIGEEATEFALRTENPTSAEFYAFLGNKYGQGGIFKTFSVKPDSFRVMFMEEAESAGGERPYSGRGYGVRDEGGMFSVSVPFLARAGTNFHGVVTINTSKRLLMRKVLEDNLFLYLALFIVLNNQVFILRYLLSRRQKDIIDRNYARPYLKQHSIGALKVMRKILDEIVEDHNEEQPKRKDPSAGASGSGGKPGSKKIISISQFLSKNSQ